MRLNMLARTMELDCMGKNLKFQLPRFILITSDLFYKTECIGIVLLYILENMNSKEHIVSGKNETFGVWSISPL